MKSYTYKYPMFIYKTQTNIESTIHNDHIDEHNESKKKLIQTLYPEYYNNNNNNNKDNNKETNNNDNNNNHQINLSTTRTIATY